MQHRGVSWAQVRGSKMVWCASKSDWLGGRRPWTQRLPPLQSVQMLQTAPGQLGTNILEGSALLDYEYSYSTSTADHKRSDRKAFAI